MTSLESELDRLLEWLCLEWGFCLSADKAETILAHTQFEAEEFAIEILRAEGFPHPENETDWIKRISQRFTDHFGKSVVRTDEFGLP